MPLSDKARIAKDQKGPRIVALWRALTALKSVVSFMNTGAHPDDETSAMLAALRFRDGIDISYACSTRGEGGQNDIGTETTEALGVLRTAEMEAACDQLDLRMYWLSESPTDTIFDFGFSKSGKETLAKWGRDRTLARFVHIIRRERPDVICPTFLDIPGQHGHHRAMTEAAHTVMELAADPNFGGCDLPEWEVKKLYLPAWSGAGQAYDDDLPPPPATLTVKASGSDPVTGWSYARIGQQSRVCHATQAMGRWVKRGDETDFPLHLAQSQTSTPDTHIASGLAVTLADLDAPEAHASLAAAQKHIEQGIAAFPATNDVLKHAVESLKCLREASGLLNDESKLRFGHKLARKETQLAHVIRIASGVEVRASFDADALRPSQRSTIMFELDSGQTQMFVQPDLPAGWELDETSVILSESADTSNPYPDTYLPGEPARPRLLVEITTDGVTSASHMSFETTPVVLPAQSVRLNKSEDIINVASEHRTVTVVVDTFGADDTATTMTVPDGWAVERIDTAFAVTAPKDVEPGLYTLPLTINERPAQSVQHIDRPHLSPRVLIRPAEIKVRVVEAKIPPVRIGYIGGGNDRVGHWLERMGTDVTDLSDIELTETELAKFDTLILGIFAMKFREGLSEAMPQIHEWTRAGGTLVTLYHRPWDNWDPDKTPPHRLEIGQPSLRWRVTDENADIDVLEPDHPLFHTPNEIGADDWVDWHKERGLYFAKNWDAAYKPLISMHDPEEQPLRGAWLVADAGKGRHIHTSLILHHQMEKLTPGAFRIMANLLATRG